MDERFEEDYDVPGLISKYEQLIKTGITHYFDVDEYGVIIDYYISYMENEKAEESLNYAFLQHPDAVLLKCKKAELLMLSGKYKKALKLIDELEYIENTTDLQLLKGTVYISMGMYKKGVRAFELALTLEEDAIHDLLFRIGLAFQHVLQFKIALKYHYRLYELDSEDLENIFELAYCYEQLGKFENSVKFYDKYLDIEPYSDKVWYNLGIIYNQLEEYEKAIEAYDYALAIRPKHGKSYFNKGNALFYMEKYEKAMGCYFKYLNYEDNHAYTHTYIGECYEKLNLFDNAVLHYQKAIDIDGEAYDAWFGLGMVAKIRGDIHEAISYLEKTAQINSYYSETYAELGDLYSEIGDDALALGAYRYASILEPRVWQYQLRLAQFHHRKGDIKEAKEVLKRTVKVLEEAGESEAELYYYLSLFSLLNGELNDAKRYLIHGKSMDNTLFDSVVNYCKRNTTLVSPMQLDELLKL